jgi:hypothetical protein
LNFLELSLSVIPFVIQISLVIPSILYLIVLKIWNKQNKIKKFKKNKTKIKKNQTIIINLKNIIEYNLSGG